jgi:predicted metallopeptidase
MIEETFVHFKVKQKKNVLVVVDFVDRERTEQVIPNTMACVHCLITTKTQQVFEIEVFYKNISMATLLAWLAHEIIHIKQINSGELKYSARRPNHMTWKKEKFIYDEECNSYADYLVLPWELEARAYENVIRYLVQVKMDLKFRIRV